MACREERKNFFPLTEKSRIGPESSTATDDDDDDDGTTPASFRLGSPEDVSASDRPFPVRNPHPVRLSRVIARKNAKLNFFSHLRRECQAERQAKRTNERTTWKMLDSWIDVKKAIKRRPYETWEWKSAFCLLPRGKVSPAVN